MGVVETGAGSGCLNFRAAADELRPPLRVGGGVFLQKVLPGTNVPQCTAQNLSLMESIFPYPLAARSIYRDTLYVCSA